MKKSSISFSAVLFAALIWGMLAVPAFAAGKMISLKEAQTIALEHAGVAQADASFTKAKLDGSEYELKFTTTNRNQYEYEISALDGRILDFDWDIKTIVAGISLEDAKLIALTHSNENYEDATFRKAKLDDGIYELDFITTTGNKYEYDISAINGNILDYEWDVRFSTSMQSLSEKSLGTAISEADAKKIALSDAGVSVSEVDYLVAYISWSNHLPATYEVKFSTRKNHKPYVYSIDLYSGKVLNIRVGD